MKSILFNTEMVRAILEDRKTVTRRVVKPQPVCYGPSTAYPPHESDLYFDKHFGWIRCRVCGNSPQYSYENSEKCHFWVPPYLSGDILYVRETFHQTPNGQYWYKADNLCKGCTVDGFCMPKGVNFHATCKICDYYDGYQNIKWHPSVHMPHEAARIFLRVTDVRAEKLQDISSQDIEREGIDLTDLQGLGCITRGEYVYAFQTLWNSTIKPADRGLYGWEANPWVWVIEFERCEKPGGD